MSATRYMKNIGGIYQGEEKFIRVVDESYYLAVCRDAVAMARLAITSQTHPLKTVRFKAARDLKELAERVIEAYGEGE